MSTSTPMRQRADALFRQALASHQGNAHARAQALYRQVIALQPRHFDALQLLGVLSLQSGQTAEAVELLARALAIDPRHAAVHSNLAFAYHTLQRYDEALASAERALQLQPAFADALNNHGNALGALGQPARALASFDAALALRADYAQAWSNRACVLRDLGRADAALASCERALALQPEFAVAWSNRGNALSDLNRPDAARRSYEQALALAPGLADAWSNRGLALVDLALHEQALDSYEQALAIAPEHVEAHWNQALCLLALGRLESGWTQYEWRWARTSMRAGLRRFAQPLWRGEPGLAGQTILLHAEQGLGDTLQFCRYAALVAQRGATVLLEVPSPLVKLLRNSLAGVAQVIDQGQPLPAFDWHCPLLSVPLACNTTLQTIPSMPRYLRADAHDVQRWQERLAAHSPAPGAALRVGLVWAGGNRAHVPELRKNDTRRSLALQQLRPWFDRPGVQFHSLQVGPAASQLDALGELARPIVDHGAVLGDFADTAALIEQLDLVISVDTAVAHLAGALGKPVWVLNRFDTCWRWLLEREDTPWYPSMRLFRQVRLGDWDSVIARVGAALDVAVRQARSGGG
jgi:tetratricopeptide (TPR) repeat protein